MDSLGGKVSGNIGYDVILEQLEILRRIAERGRKAAEYRTGRAGSEQDGRYVDIFVHLLDEIARTKNIYETYEEIE